MSDKIFNDEELLSINLDSYFSDKSVTIFKKTFANDNERRYMTLSIIVRKLVLTSSASFPHIHMMEDHIKRSERL